MALKFQKIAQSILYHQMIAKLNLRNRYQCATHPRVYIRNQWQDVLPDSENDRATQVLDCYFQEPFLSHNPNATESYFLIPATKSLS